MYFKTVQGKESAILHCVGLAVKEKKTRGIIPGFVVVGFHAASENEKL